MPHLELRSRTAASVGLALATVGLLAGCSWMQGAVDAPGAPAVTATVEPPAFVPAPLRGDPVLPGTLTNPALAAKIDNHEDARPQVGLESADLVFEELVEGGLTRYAAVWQSSVPELIGPVRSIRPMDPDILSPLGGIVAYSGGQERFVEMMEATPVYNAVHGDSDTESTFYRADDRESPHDVMVLASQLVAEHSSLGPPPQQFSYAADAASSSGAVSGTPTASLALVFSDARFPSWGWDAAGGTFLRWQEGEPDFSSTGAQLGAVNVVSMLVEEVYDYDEEVPRAVLVGSGEAWVSSGGGTVHATWSKDAAASPIRLTDDLGAPVLLAPGATWVELVPVDGGGVTVIPPAS